MKSHEKVFIVCLIISLMAGIILWVAQKPHQYGLKGVDSIESRTDHNTLDTSLKIMRESKCSQTTTKKRNYDLRKHRY